MAENWDLNAVVRGCAASTATSSAAANTTANNPLDCLASLSFEEEDLHPFGFPNLVVPRRSADLDELQGLYKPFVPTTATDSLIASASSSSGFRGSNGGHHNHHQHAAAAASTINSSPFASMSSKNQAQQAKQEQVNEQEGPRPDTSSSVPSPRMQQSMAPRSRKRKVHLKRTVCHVTAENLSADLWAWRKYGQKPIKGSPYPRNYYKCSSCKGCAARKQVERSTTDADIFIVTYTGDHTHPIPAHRNSLAGSTRNKAAIIPKLASSTATAPESPLSATSLSPTTPLTVPTEEEAPNQKSSNDECRGTEGIEEDNESNEVGEDEDEEVLIENTNTAMTEDMFLGLQQLWFRDGSSAAGASTGGGC